MPSLQVVSWCLAVVDSQVGVSLGCRDLGIGEKISEDYYTPYTQIVASLKEHLRVMERDKGV